MLISIALIFIMGLGMAYICKKMNIPRIIGMLVTGVVLGPNVLNLLDTSILDISADLRKMALVIILIKAGLSLNLEDLKKVGRPALMLSFVPATFEIMAYTIFAPLFFDISRVEAVVLGAVLSAVSPAVVVPRMVQLIEEKYGTEKGIPQMILAGASLDDVFVIVIFSTFLGMAQGESLKITSLWNIPISIILGLLLGAIVGYIISMFFESFYKSNNHIRNSEKVIIILSISFVLVAVENWLEGIVPISGLLAVMSMALTIAMFSVKGVVIRLQAKFGKLWIAAEVVLFVLVGAAVDIRYTMSFGINAIIIIFIALFVRSIGVFICMIKTPLTIKERLYCIFAYLPKATVQAAIGSVPLTLGLPCGKLVLSIAVLAIIITAPLGSFCMDHNYKKLLKQEK